MANITVCRIAIENFVHHKKEVIKELTDIDYITDEDEEELKGWSAEDIVVVANGFYKKGGDMYACPWCLLFEHKYDKDKCEHCTYGKRHGKCNGDDENDYSEVIHSLIIKGILKPGMPPFGGPGLVDVPRINEYSLSCIYMLYLVLSEKHKFVLDND